MRIYVDADGCPVVDQVIRLAGRFGVPVVLVCDTAHQFNRPGCQVITVSKGADSADFSLVNRLRPGDLAVTQDYGLAAMCLARRAVPLSQDGVLYTKENIDGLLAARHTAQKIRRGGGRLKGPPKRTPKQDEDFERTLTSLLKEMLAKEQINGEKKDGAD